MTNFQRVFVICFVHIIFIGAEESSTIGIGHQVEYEYTLETLEDAQVPWSTSMIDKNHTDWFDYFEDFEEESLSPVAIDYFNLNNVNLETLKGVQGIWAALIGNPYRKFYPVIEFNSQFALTSLENFELTYYAHNTASVAIYLDGYLTDRCEEQAKVKLINDVQWKTCLISFSPEEPLYYTIKIELLADLDGDFVLVDRATVEAFGEQITPTTTKSTSTPITQTYTTTFPTSPTSIAITPPPSTSTSSITTQSTPITSPPSTSTTENPFKYTYTLDVLSNVEVPWVTSMISDDDDIIGWFDYFEDLQEEEIPTFAKQYFHYANVSLEMLRDVKGIWAAFDGLAYAPTTVTTQATIQTDPTISTTSTTTIRTISTTPTTTEASTSTTTEDPYPWIKDYPTIEFHAPSHFNYIEYFEIKYYAHWNASVAIYLNGNRHPVECTLKSNAKPTIAEWTTCSISFSDYEDLYNGPVTMIKINLRAHEYGELVLIENVKVIGVVAPPTTTFPTTTTLMTTSTVTSTFPSTTLESEGTSESETEGTSESDTEGTSESDTEGTTDDYFSSSTFTDSTDTENTESDATTYSTSTEKQTDPSSSEVSTEATTTTNGITSTSTQSNSSSSKHKLKPQHYALIFIFSFFNLLMFLK